MAMYDMAKARDLLIVGGGVTGCVAAHVFHRKGWKVTLFDDNRAESGSRASAGVVHEHWVGKFDAEEVKIAFQTLNALFKLHKLTDDGAFFVRPSSWFTLPEGVTVIRETVDTVGDGWVAVKGVTHVGKVYVATGCWANETLGKLLPPVGGRIATACFWKGHYEGLVMEEWAPYKHTALFEQEEGVVWTGDGTVMKPSNYTDAREQQTIARVTEMAAGKGLTFMEARRGIRPYLKGVTGYYDKPMKYTWVSTAGSKSGTIWAAITARRLWEEIGG